MKDCEFLDVRTTGMHLIILLNVLVSYLWTRLFVKNRLRKGGGSILLW